MIYTVTITSQGQFSIPAKIRKQLGFNNKALVSTQGDKIIIEPVKDLLDLGGSLKTTKKPLSNDELHELFAIEKAKEKSQKK